YFGPGIEGMDNRPDGHRSPVAAELDGFVTPARVIVDVRPFLAVEKALVELQNVAQMGADPVWREAGCGSRIDAVVGPVQKPKGLAQPADIGRDERGLPWCVG